jgi:DNA polymerase-3 subunit alpha
VLPPDVNESQVDFAVVEGKIRFGLNAVKNVGEATCRAIVTAREEGGPFASIWDFTERVDPSVANKRALESLVGCGALDSTGAARRGMLHVLEDALSYGQKQQQDRLLGQASIFDLGDSPASSSRHHASIPDGEFEKPELLRMEKESLGLYVSEHPLSAIRDQLRRRTDCTLAELERRRESETVVAGGIVASLRTTTTKKGEPMAFVQLEDLTGSVEVVVFNSTYAAARDLLVDDAVLVVKGRVDHKQQGETKLVALEVAPFEATPERREVRLKLDGRIAPAGLIKDLGSVLKQFPGDAPVYVEVITSYGPKLFEFGDSHRVSPEADFFAEVKHLLGAAAVR